LLIGLTQNLYPTGRAWYMQENGSFENLHFALNVSHARLIQDAKDTIDSTIPDTNKFIESDADLWEYRLGLISNSAIPIQDRRTAILRKLSYPHNVKARQHPLYIQSQLQLAGFDVYIHENTKPYKTPEDVIALSLVNVQHGPPTQHGDGVQHGSGSFLVVANSLESNESFNVGGSTKLWATFFIAGLNLNDVASIPKEREKEFRELVLKLKPAHTVAFLIINFT